jgi:hypothetical protein
MLPVIIQTLKSVESKLNPN